MRKALIIGTLLLSSALAVTGCMEKTGDVGNKNIRSNAARGENDRMLGGGTNNMRFSNDQLNEMNRVHGDQRTNNNIVGMHGNTHLQLSDTIANNVAGLPGVGKTYVMMTDRNAYVSVSQEGNGHHGHAAGGDLAEGLKTKVADRVKSLSPSTENVYVSANPDFAERMRGIAMEARRGHPVQGFLTEFNALVERIFPAESSRSR